MTAAIIFHHLIPAGFESAIQLTHLPKCAVRILTTFYCVTHVHSALYATGRYLSVCLSVASQCSVETAERIELFGTKATLGSVL